MLTCVYWSFSFENRHACIDLMLIAKVTEGIIRFLSNAKYMWFSGSGIAKWVGNNNVCLLSLLKVWMEGRKDELPLPPHCYFPLNKLKNRATWLLLCHCLQSWDLQCCSQALDPILSSLLREFTPHSFLSTQICVVTHNT